MYSVHSFSGFGSVVWGFPVSSERYLHEQKPCILHRDLKSSNVLLTKPLRPAWEGRVGPRGLTGNVPQNIEAPIVRVVFGV